MSARSRVGVATEGSRQNPLRTSSGCLRSPLVGPPERDCPKPAPRTHLVPLSASQAAPLHASAPSAAGLSPGPHRRPKPGGATSTCRSAGTRAPYWRRGVAQATTSAVGRRARAGEGAGGWGPARGLVAMARCVHAWAAWPATALRLQPASCCAQRRACRARPGTTEKPRLPARPFARIPFAQKGNEFGRHSPSSPRLSALSGLRAAGDGALFDILE